jgi:phage terminase small subunit
MSDGPKLSPRQLKFCQEYLKSGNATDAARLAGYAEKTVNVQGPRLLVNVSVQKFLEAERKKLSQKHSIELSDLVTELQSIVFGSVGEVLDWDDQDVRIIPKKDLKPHQIKFIDNISFERRLESTGRYDENGNEEKTPVVKLKVGSLGREKTKAIELLYKMLGFDKQATTGANALETAMQTAIAKFKEEKGE